MRAARVHNNSSHRVDLKRIMSINMDFMNGKIPKETRRDLRREDSAGEGQAPGRNPESGDAMEAGRDAGFTAFPEPGRASVPGGRSAEKPLAKAAVVGTEGVYAESAVRDSGFVMNGHHCHSCYELYFVESGECRFLLEDQFQDLQAGDFLLIPPMVLHYTRYFSDPCRRTVILFRREDVAEAVRRCMPGEERFFAESSIFRAPKERIPEVEEVLRRLVAENAKAGFRAGADGIPVRQENPDAARGRTEEKSPGFPAADEVMRQCLLHELLLTCARLCAFSPGTATDIRTTDCHVLRAAQFISENYTQPITTGDVARAVGFSPNYLSRRFRQTAGIGLHEYIVFVRLHHAAQELIATGDSITDIALRCGFSDGNYFKDSFKKKYGVTPRNYRKIL